MVVQFRFLSRMSMIRLTSARVMGSSPQRRGGRVWGAPYAASGMYICLRVCALPDGDGTSTCLGSTANTVLLNSTMFVSRGKFPGMSQLVLKATADVILASTISSFQVIMT